MPGPVRIRPARAADVAVIAGIEVAAGAMFRTVGMHAVADDRPPPDDVVAAYVAAGRCWVAAAGDERAAAGGRAGTVVAFLLADEIDGAVHIEQVSVHPAWARCGTGRRLIDTAAEWGRAHGLAAQTLTTFADVPWNGPYYARLGFVVVPDTELTDGLRRIREEEARRGLDRWPRVAMRRALDPTPPL